MVYTILFNLLKNKWIWIIVLFAGMAYTAYNFYSENQKLKMDKQELVQNSAALRDSINKKEDSVQTMAVSIKNLNNDIKKIKTEYSALYSRYIVLVNSFHDSGDAVTYVPNDSVVVVKFSGKKLIAEYSGSTLYNILTQKSKWELSLSFTPIEMQSALLYDMTDSLWKIRTESLTPGIKLISYSSLDQQIFRKLEGNAPINIIQTNIFGVGIDIHSYKLSAGLVYSINKYQFGVSYDILNDYKKSSLWYDNIQASFYYFLF